MTRDSLIELLRPREFEDLFQPTAMVDSLRRMASEKTASNMLFYGSPGIGKTSAAKILIHKLGNNCYETNGSAETGRETVKDIDSAASSCGLFDGPRIIFIDEADFLSNATQAALRGIIERNRRCRFILTANDIRRFHSALKSRCTPICFDVRQTEVDGIIARLVPRVLMTLTSIRLELEEKRIRELFYRYFPDIRAAVGMIEIEARILEGVGHGK